MGISVGEALSIGGLQSGRLLAGARGLANVIDHVCVLEQPPYRQWLRPNEFMLTTFFCLKDDLDGQVESIRDLSEARSAALAIHLGNFGYRVPAALLARADELGFPVIEIPSHVSYVDIITPLMGAILDRQNYLLHRSEEIQTKLIDFVLEGGSLQSLLDTLSGLLRRQVIITGSQGEVLLMSQGKGINLHYTRDDLEADAPRSVLCAAFGAQLREHEPTGRAQLLTAKGKLQAFFLPVRIGKSTSALLSALDSVETALDQMDVAALRQGILAVSVVMMKEHAIRVTEQRMRNDLFRQLLSDGVSSKPALAERARDVGWDLTHKHIAVVLQPVSSSSGPVRSGLSDAPGSPSLTADALYVIASAVVGECSPRTIVMYKDEQIVLLPHCEGEFRREDVIVEARSIVEEIQRRCAAASPHVVPIGAIGRAYESLNDLSKSYEEACKALTLRQAANLSQPLVQFDEVVVFDVLHQLVGKGQREGTSALLSTIQPLIEYDRQKGAELVRTVECYLDCGQRLDETARRLDLHPNSVKYRLRRAQELLGFDLFGANFQMSAHLATKLARML